MMTTMFGFFSSATAQDAESVATVKPTALAAANDLTDLYKLINSSIFQVAIYISLHSAAPTRTVLAGDHDDAANHRENATRIH
jgi:hypothetical protein